MYINELTSWRNIILKDNIVTNSILDSYLLDLGFDYYSSNDLINYLESDLKISLKNCDKYSDIEFYYDNFLFFKNGCLVLSKVISEKRYILNIFNNLIFLIYKKKGSRKLNEELLISRLSFRDLNKCDIITFDNKLSEFLNSLN